MAFLLILWMSPFINAILGGLLGLLIYIMTPEYIYVNNPYEIIIIGIMSGTSSTGTNQIIKQVFKKGGNINV